MFCSYFKTNKKHDLDGKCLIFTIPCFLTWHVLLFYVISPVLSITFFPWHSSLHCCLISHIGAYLWQVMDLASSQEGQYLNTSSSNLAYSQSEEKKRKGFLISPLVLDSKHVAFLKQFQFKLKWRNPTLRISTFEPLQLESNPASSETRGPYPGNAHVPHHDLTVTSQSVQILQPAPHPQD